MKPAMPENTAKELARWADRLKQGECIIYPTETFYAVGTDGLNERAVARIDDIKQRPADKPFPLLIGSRKQLELVTIQWDEGLERLVDVFWPGPLSIIVTARKNLPSRVCDPAGRVSVRQTPHRVAQQLSLLAGAPLVATSANLSGHPPCASLRELDPLLVKRVNGVVTAGPSPGGGKPSTVIELLGPDRLLVRREGAVSCQELQEAGFIVHGVS